MSMTWATIVLPSPPYWGWLCSLAWVAGWAYVQACLSFFLEKCQQPGQLLAPWREWLDRRFGPSSAGGLRWFYKPLGGCPVCLNIWLGGAVFGLVAWVGPALMGSAWLWVVPFWVLSNRWLRDLLAE